MYSQSTLARMRLVGRALERMKADAGGRVVHTEVRLADYAETGAVPPDTEDLINYPRAVAGVEIALVFIEQKDGGTKVSFRGTEAHDVVGWPSSSAAAGTRWRPGPRSPARSRRRGRPS